MTTDWQPIYQELADLIGAQQAQVVFEYYRGSVVSFPQHLQQRQAVVTAVQADHQRGASVRQLAQRYQVAERTVRRYLKL
ncbi:Mor transcription activator family protein [Lapidilactobacillus luobeiensis]|uniref:Mor transcription activator family protein n=1 Tax=Lapidilactobacillus luobeiensis TaxID=2950371 RepID=UPI0021C27227|nr:Mor transcription activator family protein [Lapidilactobacillus luobeiensis]